MADKTGKSIGVSIHAPRVGCDILCLLLVSIILLFQFTHPVWGATRCTPVLWCMAKFQFTHPVWGATPHFSALGYQEIVSIHAPRVGCDCRGLTPCRLYYSFNSRTPCGVRPRTLVDRDNVNKFQFTHPVWGATERLQIQLALAKFQFTHPVWGATAMPKGTH